MGKPTLIVDLDDTLVRTGSRYHTAVAEGAKKLAGHTGITETALRRLLNEVDLAATAQPGGFKRERFPNSFYATAYAATMISGTEAGGGQLAEEMFKIAEDEVFGRPYELLPGVMQILGMYKIAGWQLILHTKGDNEVQLKLKIQPHGLDEIFDAVYIGLVKNADVLRDMIERQDIDVATSWMIGDSQKDDIAPAIEVGLNTALVARDTEWAYDVKAVTPTISLRSVTELVGYVPIQPPAVGGATNDAEAQNDADDREGEPEVCAA